MKKKEKIAIIGSGIAGMGSAYFLHKGYDITVFEKEAQPGGHANTVVVQEDGREVPIDTAVVIFNKANYPYFWHLMNELGAPKQRVTSTISFQYLPTGLEYAVPNLNQIFARRRNLAKPAFLSLVRELLRFGTTSGEVLLDDRYAEMTVAEYARNRGYSQAFLQQYLLPLAAALWSADSSVIMNFPIVMLVRYFTNHHMLKPNLQSKSEKYAWHGFKGGTRVYCQKLVAHFPQAMRYNTGVRAVRRHEKGATVTTTAGQKIEFDRVIFACHADQALGMLVDPTPLEKELLGPFKYKSNSVTVHTDDSLMPRHKRAWAAFNCRVSLDKNDQPILHQNYYTNFLQKLDAKQNYFSAIGNNDGIDPAKIIQQFSFRHVVYSVQATAAQARLSELNQNGRTYFCGSYFKNGFHEDALVAALEVARGITGKNIWGDID